MPVEQLDIAGFTVFEGLSLDFSPGINVFLGANSTGKSHLLKLIYSLLGAWRDARRQWVPSSKEPIAEAWTDSLRSKLDGVFRPDERNVGRLVRGGSRSSADLGLFTTGATLHATLSSEGEVTTKLQSLPKKEPVAIFLPAREVLSMYEGFVAAYENRELSFDETYYDLCKALATKPLRGTQGKRAEALYQPLLEHLHVSVRQKGDRFYIGMQGEGIMEAHLVAEGLRKIATVTYLISNGSLMKNGILFWDEPEANLNPRLIKMIADFLLDLAAAGVQIFLATHDYLLTNELSLQAEYKTEMARKADIRFFGFSREPDGSVQVQPGSTLADLDHNPIMEEFAALYDRERHLFYESDRTDLTGA
jgi:predicted ATPase